MEKSSSNTWNLPEDPFERQARVEEIADELIIEYDKIAFAGFNKILEQVRENERTRTRTENNL